MAKCHPSAAWCQEIFSRCIISILPGRRPNTVGKTKGLNLWCYHVLLTVVHGQSSTVQAFFAIRTREAALVPRFAV